jgi:hypothetical protein
MAKMERGETIAKGIFAKYMPEKATKMLINQLAVGELNILSLSRKNLITSETKTADTM